MRFITYLLESKNQMLIEKHDLVLQKIIDSIDNSHIDYSTDRIQFDLGTVSGSAKLRGLKMVIKPGQSDKTYLSRTKDGKIAIVISTTEDLPGRQDIDSFLSTNAVYDGFRDAYLQYLNNFHDHNKEYEETDSDIELSLNNRDSFEGKYNDIIEVVKLHLKKYNDVIGELDQEGANIGNIGRKLAIADAKKRIRKEFLGNNSKEFISKILNMPEADFVKYLNRDWRSKLEARLVHFFNEI